MSEETLRAYLRRADPEARDALKRVLIADLETRNQLAEGLLRQRTEEGINLADLIDILTLNPGIRRQVVRLLGELEAS